MMQTNLRSCPCCQEEFNRATRIPRTLLQGRGDTLCSQCLQEILNGERVCHIEIPQGVQVIEDVPINNVILEALNLSSVCSSRHQDPKEFICITHNYQRICDDCEDECSSKGHNIKSLREIETKAEKKKRVLQKFANDFDTEYDEVDYLLNEKQEALITIVDKTFELFKKAIEQTKNQIKQVIFEKFEEQKQISDQAYNHDIELKNKTEALLHTLNEKAYDGSYFTALNTLLKDFKVISQKPRIEDAVNELDKKTETIGVELMNTLARISNLFSAQDPLENGKIEQEQDGVQNHIEAPENHGQDIMEEEQQQQRMPRIEIEDDYRQAVSLFHAEIEENDRLILSFKNHQIETENILNVDDLERLRSINKITLNINKSPLWKEAINNFQQIWNKLGKIIDLKIDFSFKTHSIEILEALSEQNNIWATSDLLEFAINLSSSPVEDEHLIQLYERAILNMVNVQKLEVVLENTQITDHSVKVFAEKTLPNLANLTEFRFYVDQTKISDNAMESLLTAIHNQNTNLIGLAFGFDDTAITDKTIGNIAQKISPLASELRRFDLSVKNTNVSDNGLEVLFEAFDSQLGKFEEFTLDLANTKVSNQGLKFFVQDSPPKMASLEAFELFLNQQKRITNKIIDSIAKVLESSVNLKKIRLELGGSGISGTTLEQLILKNKPALETFELNIAETIKIDVTEINDFLEKIEKEQTFQNLKHVSFYFSQLKLSDRSCELLANSIQQCANLQILQLQLGKNKKITDRGLIFLSKSLNQVLQRTKLTEFQLYLDSTKVTDQGVKVFSEQVVRSLVGVKSFELYLIFLPGVTNQGAEVLFTDLSTVAESLRNIDISLYGTGITNDSLRALSHSMWNAKPKLESFALSVGNNTNITDEGLEWLLSDFEPILQSLKSFKLNIENTEVSQERVELLKQYLEVVPNALENFEIEIGQKHNGNLQNIVEDLEEDLI